MKSFIILLILTILLSNKGFCYKEPVHTSATAQAVINYNLDKYLQNHLGIDSNKLLTNNKGIRYSAGEWLINGSYWEDNFFPVPRFKNHFYEPTTGLGLNGIACSFESSLAWATIDSENIWGWNAAKNYFNAALVSTVPSDKDQNLANMFRSIGQLMHLIEDLAAPAHVRNDIHLPVSSQKDLYEEFTAKRRRYLTYTGYPVVDLQTFTNINSFWSNNGKGLAEYTNKNFLSRDTNISDNPYPSPLPIGEWLTTETITDAKRRYVQVEVKYLQGYATDSYLPEKSAPISRLAAYSYLDDEMKRLNNQRVYSLNDFVHKEYAQFLIPRAVGYAAGLLNYFFRGTIELTLPDSGVYSVTDPFDFELKEVRVKAKNTTSTGELMSNGQIKLVVRYRLALEDPFRSEPVDIEPEYRYIVVPEKTGRTSIPKDAPVELVFDLSATPIPLWATNLYLQVVYRGQLGAEADAVAVGLKDISEPTPVDLYNNTDYTCINGTWLSSGSPAAVAAVDTNNDGIADRSDVYPHTISYVYANISPVGSTVPASPTAFDIYEDYPSLPGGLLRIGFVLSDYAFSYGVHEKWLKRDPNDTWDVIDKDHQYPGTAVMNQTGPDDIDYYPYMYNMRGRKMWWGAGVIYDNNEYPSGSSCSWDDM